MPDIATAAAAAGAKPILKLVLKYRPGKLMKDARKAEEEVTNILFERASIIPDHVYKGIKSRRLQCDAARTEAEKASWLKKGIVYVQIVYTYYEAAHVLLRMTKLASEAAARENGPEGMRNAVTARASHSTTGALVSYTVDNVALHPGQNTLTLPFTSDVAQLCEVTVRAKAMIPPGTEAAQTVVQGHEDGDDNEDETLSVSVTLSPGDGDGQDGGGQDSTGLSLELSDLGKRGRHSGPNASIEIDLSDFTCGDD
ncbi:hypothetical protein K466DRAFT_650300 [Polyporus arcularius HHB13444]|uniref:Uncharacterized protein n=1 Tax=Polyporus arcularius HHB13444 TaxID=1314778 RepID=A0A5C3PTB8_9APHY|nr:hypothetical protein K466DRAFT_650300 [Polyporus arcularius HHB13444]